VGSSANRQQRHAGNLNWRIVRENVPAMGAINGDVTGHNRTDLNDPEKNNDA
jgi:hypothetical protein